MPISAGEPLLRVASLSTGYGKIGVLRGVNLTVRASEVVALVQSGSVDVAVLALPGEPPAGVVATPLTEEPLRVAVPVDDELAGRTVKVDDLRGLVRVGRPHVLVHGVGGRAQVLAEHDRRVGSRGQADDVSARAAPRVRQRRLPAGDTDP